MTSYDAATEGETGRRPTAAELFAGVGGFHLALDRAGFDVVWSNQWEPATKAQHAHECYQRHVEAGDFQLHGREMRGIAARATDRGLEAHVASNDDIAKVLDIYEKEIGAAKRGRAVFQRVPDVDLLVGGFPCQDYSVAKTLRQAHGIVGKKGVLWWEIHRLLRLKLATKRPIQHVFLENVDRLIKSPASQRGRDFAVMLASLAEMKYEVEWRVVNAADYGFPQKRRRVFIVGTYVGDGPGRQDSPYEQILSSGPIARALPAESRLPDSLDWDPLHLSFDLKAVSDTFNLASKPRMFGNAGALRLGSRRDGAAVYTLDVVAARESQPATLGSVLEDEHDVPPHFFVEDAELEQWRRLKGAKRVERISKASGLPYTYDEGAIPFPDPTDRPSRTILTGEGGRAPSRFKHLIQTPSGRYRRLTPRELEMLNGFPPDWTAGMPDGKRAFMMGNALVVGLVEKIADELIRDVTGSVSVPVERAAAS